MTKLNRKVEYALMSLKALSEDAHGKIHSAKEIAEKINAPFDVAARVLQNLAQKNFISVERGYLGGYRLAISLDEVTLLQLIEIFEGPLAVVKCQKENSTCDIEKLCGIISPMKKLNQRLNHFYSDITLSELLNDESGHHEATSKKIEKSEGRRHV